MAPDPPDEWKRVRVRDVFVTGRGRVISRKEIEANPGPYPVYSSQSTDNGVMGRLASYDFEGEYVTWTTDGAYAGTVFHRVGRFNCTNVCGTLTMTGDHQVSLDFAAYYLGSVAKRHVSRVGNDKLMNNVFGEIPLLLPPLPEQRKIAAILASVDDAIAATQAIIDQLQVVKKAMMAELLTRGLPGRHTRFKRTEIGEVPEEWEVVRLEEVALLQTGIAKGKVEGAFVEVPYLRVANVQDGYIDISEVKTIRVPAERIQRYSLSSGDVLFTEGGDADKVGRGAVWRAEIQQCLHQNHVFAVRPKRNRLLPEYLSHYGASASGKEYFLGCAKQTTNLASINSSQLRALPLALPPISEQEEIVNAVDSLAARLFAEVQTIAGLTQLKSDIMSVLLTGEIRVKVDEPPPKEAASRIVVVSGVNMTGPHRMGTSLPWLRERLAENGLSLDRECALAKAEVVLKNLKNHAENFTSTGLSDSNEIYDYFVKAKGIDFLAKALHWGWESGFRAPDKKAWQFLLAGDPNPLRAGAYSDGRNRTWEFLIASLAATFSSEVVFGEPDVTCEFQSKRIGIAAKVTYSQRQVWHNVRKGMQQGKGRAPVTIVMANCVGLFPGMDLFAESKEKKFEGANEALMWVQQRALEWCETPTMRDFARRLAFEAGDVFGVAFFMPVLVQLNPFSTPTGCWYMHMPIRWSDKETVDYDFVTAFTKACNDVAQFEAAA